MQRTPDWTDAVIQSVTDITPTVREIILAPAAGVQTFAPGAHLQVQVLVAGRPQTRSYSLVGLPDGNTYCIAVKRLDAGRGGSLAMWRLAPGDRLKLTAPQNFFPLDLSAPAYLLIAGGIGVTPLVSMAQTLAQRGASVHMVLAARTESELAYAPRLREALGEGLHLVDASRGQTLDFAAEIAALAPGGQLYFCGPAPMLDAARQAWSQAGRPAADLRFETFGTSGRLAPQAFQARIARQNLDIEVPADSSLLDALEMAGVQAMSGCRRGECGLCALDVTALEGEIDHRDVFLSEREKAENHRICVCVSRVVGRITLDCAYRPDA
jgi:vanillate O-demethylase ferredoxin subunit